MKKLTEFIADVEYPVLIFPVIVALTVAVTFLFPFGKCGLWQWWLSTALTLALIVRQKMPWRHCFAFWVLFVVFSLVKTRNFIIIKKSLSSGAVISAVFLIMSVSPYLTVYLEYGHPLYPVYTCDEKRFPPYNMTLDFLFRNDDAASMGRVGA